MAGARKRRLWMVISASLITLISAGMLAWNASSSIVDPDPPPVVHRNPPEGTRRSQNDIHLKQ